MKYFLLLMLFVSGCFLDDNTSKDNDDSLINREVGTSEQRITNKAPLYRFGSNEDLVKIIYQTINAKSIDQLKSTFGAYELLIHPNGKVAQSNIRKSIADNIDSLILLTCDTLTFVPENSIEQDLLRRIIIPIRLHIE